MQPGWVCCPRKCVSIAQCQSFIHHGMLANLQLSWPDLFPPRKSLNPKSWTLIFSVERGIHYRGAPRTFPFVDFNSKSNVIPTIIFHSRKYVFSHVFLFKVFVVLFCFSFKGPFQVYCLGLLLWFVPFFKCVLLLSGSFCIFFKVVSLNVFFVVRCFVGLFLAVPDTDRFILDVFLSVFDYLTLFEPFYICLSLLYRLWSLFCFFYFFLRLFFYLNLFWNVRILFSLICLLFWRFFQIVWFLFARIATFRSSLVRSGVAPRLFSDLKTETSHETPSMPWKVNPTRVGRMIEYDRVWAAHPVWGYDK